MKYIRTKGNRIGDRILKVDYEEYSYFKCKDEVIIKEEVLKQADTIEELCDEFVYFINGMPFVTHKGEKHYVAQGIPVVIYGAIWTEWGLKYIAKMNDKGEFELL